MYLEAIEANIEVPVMCTKCKLKALEIYMYSCTLNEQGSYLQS